MCYIRYFAILLFAGFLFLSACGSKGKKKMDITTTQKDASFSSQNKITNQQLLKASLEGNITVVKEAVSDLRNIDQADQAGRTSLILAAYNGHTDVVELLLQNGADPNKGDVLGRTPLIFAASGPYPDTVTLLLEHGADPNTKDKKEGWSPLMWAAAEGNIHVARALIYYNADPEMSDIDNETAYDFATSNGHTKIAKLLKEAGNEK